MGIIERIHEYLKEKDISAYEFERTCDISNGYLNSRKGGTRGIGSEILEKIYRKYPDLNLIWLITGDGQMLNDSQAQTQAQPQAQPHEIAVGGVGVWGTGKSVSVDAILAAMREQIDTLKTSNADKDKIIHLLEAEISTDNKTKEE